MVAVVRYDAIGSLATHDHVVQPLRVRWPASTPLATASSPAGTVMSNRYEAASLGWSLTGYHVAATSGCPTTRAPSSVWTNPEMPPSTDHSTVSGHALVAHDHP